MSSTKVLATISLIKDKTIQIRPKIVVSRDKNGKSGKALFTFQLSQIVLEENPDAFKEMVMKDEEGELKTRAIRLNIENSKTHSLEAIYEWKTDIDFARFIRFVDSYSKSFKYPDSSV